MNKENTLTIKECKHNYVTLYCANTMSGKHNAITITTYECHKCGKFKTIVSNRF